MSMRPGTDRELSPRKMPDGLGRRVNRNNRRYITRQIIFATPWILILLGTNVACNTVHGFGQDVERAGEKTQDVADAVKKKL